MYNTMPNVLLDGEKWLLLQNAKVCQVWRHNKIEANATGYYGCAISCKDNKTVILWKPGPCVLKILCELFLSDCQRATLVILIHICTRADSRSFFPVSGRSQRFCWWLVDWEPVFLCATQVLCKTRNVFIAAEPIGQDKYIRHFRMWT